MKRFFTLFALLVFLLMLPACAKHSTLVCDSCGITFEGDDDYSKQLARDEEIMSTLGIDLYSFYCPDCRRESHFGAAIVYHFMDEEDSARLRAYDAWAEMTDLAGVDPSITIIASTNLDPYYIAEDNTTGLYGIYNITDKNWEASPVFSLIDAYDSNELALDSVYTSSANVV